MFLNQKYLKPKPLQTETSFDALIFNKFLSNFDDNILCSTAALLMVSSLFREMGNWLHPSVPVRSVKFYTGTVSAKKYLYR